MTEEKCVSRVIKLCAQWGRGSKTVYSGLCDHCGEVGFTYMVSRKRTSAAFLCSYQCVGRRMVRGRGPQSRHWKGGRTYMGCGYIESYAPSHPAAKKNGKKDDNRIENLELWAKPQPAGQRVEDLVDWVADNYADRVRGKLLAKDAVKAILDRLSNSKPASLNFKAESTGAGDGL